MQERSKRLTSAERKKLVQKIIGECRDLADRYIKDWKPADPQWPTIDGCAYLRLSTEHQVAVEKGSLEQQVNIAVSEAEIRSHHDRVNYRIRKFFIEPGLTGRNDRRPEFLQMRAKIKQGEFKFVVIKEIARLSRETRVWKDFFQECQQSRCRIIIRGLPFDPNSPEQILQLDILSAFAEYESNLISKRTKESAFSAMITSGKFNSTHQVLGLDQRVVDGVAKVGFYVPNSEELKTVEWIMRSFVRYASYQKTLEECEKRGILNKNGQPFASNSLQRLLTNLKYIGKWEVNTENKDRNARELAPYDAYALVDLSHGPVVDLELWKDVQSTVKRIANNRAKNTNIRRIFPLSGILHFKDGTRFQGGCAWKEDNRHSYYYNPKHKIRLKAEDLEESAKEMVAKVIQESPELREAIKRRGINASTTVQLLGHEIDKRQDRLNELEEEKGRLNRRLDFLLLDENGDGQADFREEYKRELAKLNAEIGQVQDQLGVLGAKRRECEAGEFDWRSLKENARKVLDIIGEHDPVALKTAYAHFFEAAVIGDLDDQGIRPVEFIFRDDFSPNSTFVAAEEKSRVIEKMG